MKRSPNSLIAVFTVALFGLTAFACGSSSDGPSCQSVCEFVAGCDADQTVAECTQDCQDLKGAFRPAVFSYMGNCMLDLTCAEFNTDGGDTCMESAMSKGSASAVDNFVDAVCDKAVSCDPTGTYTHAACVTELTADAGDDFAYLGMLKDSILSCMKSCVSDTACDQLENAMEGCFSDCGLDNLFGDDGGDNTTP